MLKASVYDTTYNNSKSFWINERRMVSGIIETALNDLLIFLENLDYVLFNHKATGSDHPHDRVKDLTLNSITRLRELGSKNLYDLLELYVLRYESKHTKKLSDSKAKYKQQYFRKMFNDARDAYEWFITDSTKEEFNFIWCCETTSMTNQSKVAIIEGYRKFIVDNSLKAIFTQL